MKGESVMYETFGYALAVRVLQSDLYAQLDDKERAECDELIRRGQELPRLIPKEMVKEFKRGPWPK